MKEVTGSIPGLPTKLYIAIITTPRWFMMVEMRCVGPLFPNNVTYHVPLASIIDANPGGK